MLVLGIDVHKRTHTVVVVDEAGRKLGQHTTTSATTTDHLELVRCGRTGSEQIAAGRWRTVDICHAGWSVIC